MSRLSIEISPKEHQHIKALAAMEGQSIKEYVLGKLFPDENARQKSWTELNEFLSTRMDQAISGQLSSKSITQIMDKEIKASKNA